VLEKIKFEDSLKELSVNQQKILENQEEIKKTLSAIEGLLNERLEKRARRAQQSSTTISTSTPVREKDLSIIRRPVSPVQLQLYHTSPCSASSADSISLSNVSQSPPRLSV